MQQPAQKVLIGTQDFVAPADTQRKACAPEFWPGPHCNGVEQSMATNVLVVDDSTVSRKMLIRSLPPEWEITLSEATNGVEAVAAYHEGKAEVMFLDLTMPVMDGYQVLETLQKEGLNTFVIVVSADIQPEAEQRVKKLGAMAFIKKPVAREKIMPILKEFGIV